MSESLPPRSTGLSVMGQVRAYSDDEMLERVWSRLEVRRRKPVEVRPLIRLAAAAALLAAGFLGGRLTSVDSEPLSERNSSELFARAESPSGAGAPSRESVRSSRRARPSDQTAKKARKVTASSRRRAAGLSAEIDSMLDEEFVETELLEAEPEAVEVVPTRPAWLALADRGDFAAAFQQLDESGGFDSVLAVGSAEELMTLVDVARYVGNQGRAIQALRVVTERHQQDANAPLAAMMLGNLLSRAGDQAGASAAFALNRRLSPGGDFAEDALVREFDMAMAASDLPTVLKLQSQYEEEFPQGRHLEKLRVAAKRLGEASSVGSSDASERGSDSDESLSDSAQGKSDSAQGKSDSAQGKGDSASGLEVVKEGVPAQPGEPAGNESSPSEPNSPGAPSSESSREGDSSPDTAPARSESDSEESEK